MFDFLKNINKSKEQPKKSLEFKVTDNGLKKIDETPQVEQVPKLTLEEELELLETKKSEIAELINQRHDYLVEAKNLEEKILAQGITAEKALEIRNRIIDQTGELSKQIIDIRNEYSIQATPVEVYSMRYKMICNEIERIQNNMSPEYSAILSSFRNFFGETDDVVKNRIIRGNGKAIISFKEYLSKDFKNNDQVIIFLEGIKDINVYDGDLEPVILEKLLTFRNTLQNKIAEETTYKTPGEKREAQIKLDRLVRLSDDIIRELRNAEKKEDRFENNKNIF